MAKIRIERDESEPIARVVISNPERRNAVGRADTQELAAAIREVDADDEIRCVILTGEGDAFCAGLDLTSIEGSPTADLVDRSFHAAVREIATCGKPVVSRVRGPAIGAGAALAVACDMVYAESSARIGFSFARIGLSADTGATFTLPRLVGPQQALELLMTGRILDGEEAAEIGLVTDVAPPETFDDLVDERVGALANGPTRSLSALRRLVLRSNASSFETHLEMEAREQIGIYHTNDAMEGIAAFAADRDPEFEGV